MNKYGIIIILYYFFMIDLPQHPYMLQRYTCYNVTPSSFGQHAFAFGGNRQGVSKNYFPSPNYWKISGKATYHFFPDICSVNLISNL